ncbi:MAG: hypothetical protein KC656_36240, partial [Myxococcales bacterium]|nr:hypothetical protein [Myxococcales bacterium]
MPDTEPTLDVVWLLPDGQGGGRTARGTFKVRGALPGDRIVPVTSRSRGRTLEVERFTWASQGPREAHPCTVIDRCGGCDLGRMPGDRRKDALLRMVRQSLRLDADPAW